MALNPRVVKAFIATRALGLHDEEVKPILKKLLEVYEKNWELIEEDNYRTLFDAFFENKENKGVEDKDKIEGAAAGHSSSKKSSKRLHLPEPENQSSRLRIMESSSQPCLVDRTESSSQLPCAQSCDKGKRSILSHVHSGWSKSNSKKPPYAQEPLDKPSSIHFKRENVPTLPGLSEDSSSHHSVKPILSENGDIHEKLAANSYDEKRPLQYVDDITKGSEKVKIPLVDEIGNCCLPKFNYIPHNIIYQNGNVNISLARIADEDCCSSCSGDCLSSPIPCACARETGGEFAYTPQGLLTEDFLGACLSRDREPQEHHYVHCDDCPIERSRNKSMPEKCKGHLVRKFIKECWRKCGCNMKCGNRVVQRGITCKLQVFLTCDGKGWGLRPLEDLPKGTFVCEYVGEILTNSELFDRNKKTVGNGRHTYPVTLDADWGSEKILVDDEALCLDATFHGNAARFINHRCCDANLVEIPVEVETPDHHYYHLAFFTSRQVSAMEELTWDYGIDFSDKKHPVKAFRCCCKSSSCRDKKRKRK